VEHLTGIPGVVEALQSLGKDYRSITGEAYTMLKDGHPVACYGVAVLRPGVAEVWMFVRPGEPLWTVAKALKRHADRCRDTYQRVSATCRADHPAAGRFLAWLGLRFEGTLHGYGIDGADHLLFAAWRE
jgi:hypothetical protein